MPNFITISHYLSWNILVYHYEKGRGNIVYAVKRAQIGQTDFVTVYVSVVRPVLVYVRKVWNTTLQEY